VKKDAEPLFKLGYGLTYKSTETVGKLSESSGLENSEVASTGVFYSKGTAVAPWGLWLSSGDLVKQVGSFPTSVGGLLISKTDYKAQEDALRIRIKWTKSDLDQMRLTTASPSSMSREATGSMELAFAAKSFKDTAGVVKIGMCGQDKPCDKVLDINISAKDWKEYRISLSCFGDLGVDMTKISTAFMITAGEGVDIGLGNIRLESDIDAKPGCDGK